VYQWLQLVDEPGQFRSGLVTEDGSGAGTKHSAPEDALARHRPAERRVRR
jgi:hypothetical protein